MTHGCQSRTRGCRVLTLSSCSISQQHLKHIIRKRQPCLNWRQVEKACQTEGKSGPSGGDVTIFIPGCATSDGAPGWHPPSTSSRRAIRGAASSKASTGNTSRRAAASASWVGAIDARPDGTSTPALHATREKNAGPIGAMTRGGRPTKKVACVRPRKPTGAP